VVVQGRALLEAAGGHVIRLMDLPTRDQQTRTTVTATPTGDCRILICVHGCRRFGSFVTKVGRHLHTIPVFDNIWPMSAAGESFSLATIFNAGRWG
jgi:hypothetical protein